MTENELYHYGVIGMKWGVRRYQNKDGSLTYAGKKRALSMQNKYDEFTKNKKYHNRDGSLTYKGRKKALKMKEKYTTLTGKQLRKIPSTDAKKKTKSKSISSMSNDEIQAKIDRLKLEQTLKSLTPDTRTKGQKFADGLKDATLKTVKEKGTKLVGDYVDKQIRKKLGLGTNTSEALKKMAQDYENRQKIDKGQQYFKEGKYAETNQNKKSKTENVSGTVEGEEKNTHSKNKRSTSSNKDYPPVDVTWRDVTDDDINRGDAFVSSLLLEDKKRKK